MFIFAAEHQIDGAAEVLCCLDNHWCCALLARYVLQQFNEFSFLTNKHTGCVIKLDRFLQWFASKILVQVTCLADNCWLITIFFASQLVYSVPDLGGCIYTNWFVDVPKLALPHGITGLVLLVSGWHQSLRVQ